MTPGTYGFLIPDPGDESSTRWMPDQRWNWGRVDLHDHDGVNSKKVAIPSFVKVSQSYTAAGWVLIADGIYRQEVTFPVGYLYDNTIIYHQITNGTYADHKWEPRTVKIGIGGSYWVYCNDNTVTFDVRFF
jgi:hypothetical protein